MTDGVSEHAPFVLPTQEDVAAMDSGRNPRNVLWLEFTTRAEFEAYLQGLNAIEDQFDELDALELQGDKVLLVRDGEGQIVRFESVPAAEAYRQGIMDAEAFHAPLVIGRDDERFARLLDFRRPAGPGSAHVVAPRDPAGLEAFMADYGRLVEAQPTLFGAGSIVVGPAQHKCFVLPENQADIDIRRARGGRARAGLGDCRHAIDRGARRSARAGCLCQGAC